MAKVKTACERCGGSFDGTPSGWLKHQRSDKHNTSFPIAGDGIPEGFPDAFAGDIERLKNGGTKPVADAVTEPEFTVAKAEVIEATEAAIETKVKTRSKDAAKAAVAEGISAILAGEATAEEVLEQVREVAPVPEPSKPKQYVVQEYEPVVLPDFDPSDLPERPASVLFSEFRPYEFPDRPEAVQQFAVENAEELAAAEKDVATGKRYVRHGKLHSLALLPKYEAQLASAENRLAAAQVTQAGIQAYDEQRFAAHYVNAKLYWETVHGLAQAQVKADGGLEQGTLELTGAIPTICFRSVNVNGPRKVLEGEQEIVVPATVTLVNPVASCDPDIAEMIGRDLTAAGRYAVALNAVIGL